MEVVGDVLQMISFLPWNESIWGSDFATYLKGLGVFLCLLLGFFIFKRVVLRRLHRLSQNTQGDLDDVLLIMVESVSKWFYFYLSFYGGMRVFDLPELKVWFDSILIATIVREVASKLRLIIRYIFRTSLQKNGKKLPVNVIQQISEGVVWLLGGLLILSNLGIDITSLVAGLGIGGVAVALALQNILGDIFSSFAIYFDKPFEIGDFIVVGESEGTVEKIGLKTTRIKALSGEEIVIANNDLISARISNYKRMKTRRVSFAFGLSCQTPQKKLEKVSSIVEGILSGIEKVELQRVHFKNLGEYSLEFEVVYVINSAEYADYMDAQEEINFKILEKFAKEKIELAFPTQEIYLKK